MHLDKERDNTKVVGDDTEVSCVSEYRSLHRSQTQRQLRLYPSESRDSQPEDRHYKGPRLT